MRIAEKGMYRPLQSRPILTEAQEAIEEIHPGIDVTKRFALMREAFDDAMVIGWEELVNGIALPDEDDRHVAATAVVGGADAITLRITDELRRDVEDLASAEGRPVAEVARAALEEYVSAHRHDAA